MPQLDPAYFPTQLFWLFLTFVPLYLIMLMVALPRVTRVLNERDGRISGDLTAAETMKRDADEARAAYQEALGEARAKAQDILAANRKKLQEEVENKLAELGAKLAADATKAEASIAAAKLEALASIRQVTADLCHDLIVRIAGIEPNPASVSEVVAAKLARSVPIEADLAQAAPRAAAQA